MPPDEDPDESGAIVELNACSNVTLDGGNNQVCKAIVPASARPNNALIDISLAKLFKCMNLAYR